MTDKPAESAAERYENAETRILWRDEVAHNVATKFVSKKEADDALAELQAKLAAAEAALAKMTDQYEVLQAAYEGAKEAAEPTELHPLPPLVDAHLRFGRVDPLERGDLVADLETKLAAAEERVRELEAMLHMEGP